jgi:hypothetical protein
MSRSRVGRVANACSSPTIRSGIVSTAGVQSVEIVVDAAPDDHIAAGPHRRLRSSGNRRASRAGGCPTICPGFESSTCVRREAIFIAAAPDDHFTAIPDCRMRVTAIRRVRGAGG